MTARDEARGVGAQFGVRACLVEALENRRLLSFSALINFQPAGAPVPTGYLADTGAAFGPRGGGLSFGWNADNSANTVDRNSSLSPDQRFDTFAHLQRNGTFTWDLAVPVGTYFVKVVSGDAASISGFYETRVEGYSLAVIGQPSNDQRWLEGTAFVLVDDGRLSISSGSQAVNNKINFIEVTDAIPLSPVNVTATAVSGRRVDVSWVDNANNETGFRIERSSDFVNFTTLATVGANVTSFTDNTVTPSTTFIYRLTAFNHVGDSLSHNSPAIVTPSIPELAPAAPTNLSRSINNAQVTLTWDDNSINEEKFIVEQKGGFFVNFFPVAQTLANQNSITLSVGNGQDLRFRVKAFNTAGGDSLLSNEVRAVTRPAAPINVFASGPTQRSIQLGFSAYGATSFTIQRRVGDNWTTVGQTTQQTFVEQNLPPNSTHRYRVIASNDGGDSDPTEVLGSTARPRVTGLRATQVTTNSVALAWNDVAGEFVFRVERSADGINFTTAGTVVANQVTFTDANLPASTTLFYRIVAVSFSQVDSPASEVIQVRLPGARRIAIELPEDLTQMLLS